MIQASVAGERRGPVQPGTYDVGIRERSFDKREEVTRMKALGRHLIVELWDCLNLNDAQSLETGLREAVAAIDGTLLDVHVIEFPVHGVTGVAIISESHIAVHTWPEHGYAAVDIFTCNLEADVHAGVQALSRHLLPGRHQVMEVQRGLMPGAGAAVAQ